MNPDRMFKALRVVVALEHSHNKLLQRFRDWEHAAQVPKAGSRGGGFGQDGEPADRAVDRRLARQASGYRTELDTLVKRMCADAERYATLTGIAHPENPDAAPDAGCRSCVRDGGRYEPLSDKFRGACCWCGQWRAAHGEWPPLAVVVWRGRNPGKRVPTLVVEKAG